MAFDNKEYQRQYYKDHTEQSKTASKRWAKEHRSACAESSRVCRARVKKAVYALLGDVCVQCGFSDARALNIDHVNGGGSKEGSAIGTDGIYRKILKMEHPENEYQILCCNCNWIKRHEHGEVGGRPCLSV